MKKILILASAILLFAGCAKEILTENKSDGLTLVFSATQEGNGTKAAIGSSSDGKTAINWQEGDSLIVIDGWGSACIFETKGFDANNPTHCSFEGEVNEPADEYMAVYPFKPFIYSCYIEPYVFKDVYLPEVQTAVPGSFDPTAALMLAKTEAGSYELAFKNAVGFVKLTPTLNCNCIELCSGSGEPIAGPGYIRLGDDGTPVFSIYSDIGSDYIDYYNLNTIKLVPKDGSIITAGSTYYIAVPVTTLSAGWEVRLTRADGSVFYTKTSSKPVQFKRNVILNLGEIGGEIPYVTFSSEREQTFIMDGSFPLGEGEYFEYSVGGNEWVRFTTPVNGIAFGGKIGNLRLRGKSRYGTGEAHIYFPDRYVECTGDIVTLVDYEGCYIADTRKATFRALFAGCPLISAPELSATDLAYGCYEQMFMYCDYLESAPKLPATRLTDGCYQSMFENCRSLKNAPELPALELAPGCYLNMFCGCSSLEIAPELPANKLIYGCYYGMFERCKSLNEIKIFATDGFDSESCLQGFLDNTPGPGNIYFMNEEAANQFISVYPLDNTDWQIKYLAE